MQVLRTTFNLLRRQMISQSSRSSGGTVVPYKPGDIYVDLPLFPFAYSNRWLLTFQIGLYCGIPFAIPFYGLRRALMKQA
ncbi:hypothetical protein T08_4911 [Trichinella sp. T8]|nr:hypothetical protein T08_4911 [Trichinella sp. T8]